MKYLIEDLVKYNYPNREHVLAQEIINIDELFAKSLYFELQMQLLLLDKDFYPESEKFYGTSENI